MLTNLLAVAILLTLSAGSAMAEEANSKEQTQFTSTSIEVHSSDQIRSSLAFATKNRTPPEAAIGATATERRGWKQEPESISRGTEP
jgi:hypothetical protein